jgi:hypothetical protein
VILLHEPASTNRLVSGWSRPSAQAISRPTGGGPSLIIEATAEPATSPPPQELSLPPRPAYSPRH